MSMTQFFEPIQQALDSGRYETARRLCLSALAKCSADDCSNQFPLRVHLHSAYRALGDFRSALAALEAATAMTSDQAFEIALLIAEDVDLLSDDAYYRESDEAKAGLTIDEYSSHYLSLANLKYRELMPVATTARHHVTHFAASLLKSKRADLAGELGLSDVDGNILPDEPAARTHLGTADIEGCLRLPDGSPVPAATLVLGLEVGYQEADASTYNVAQMHYDADTRLPITVTTSTDRDGAFAFRGVPAGTHEFIAALLDLQVASIPTRFVAQQIKAPAGSCPKLNLVVNDWQSAEASARVTPFESQRMIDGRTWDRVHVEHMVNPFHFSFPHQAVHLDVRPDFLDSRSALKVFDSAAPDVRLPHQVADDRLLVFTHLDPLSERSLAVYRCEKFNGGQGYAIELANTGGCTLLFGNDRHGRSHLSSGMGRSWRVRSGHSADRRGAWPR